MAHHTLKKLLAVVLDFDISKQTGVVIVIIYCLNFNLCFLSYMSHERKRDICAKVTNHYEWGRNHLG